MFAVAAHRTCRVHAHKGTTLSHTCIHMSISATKSILMGKRALSVVNEASDSSASDEDDDKLPNTTSLSSSAAAGTASGDGFDSVSNERQHKRKQKKEDKKLKKSVEAGRGTRADFVNVYGAAARPELIAKWDDLAKRDQRLSAWDFQALVLWCLADVVQPRWMFVKNKPLLEKILIVSVDGLAPSTFRLVPALRGIGHAPPAGDGIHLFAASQSSSSFSASPSEWPLAMPLSDPAETRRASHELCCGAVPGLDAFAPASLHVRFALHTNTLSLQLQQSKDL